MRCSRALCWPPSAAHSRTSGRFGWYVICGASVRTWHAGARRSVRTLLQQHAVPLHCKEVVAVACGISESKRLGGNARSIVGANKSSREAFRAHAGHLTGFAASATQLGAQV